MDYRPRAIRSSFQKEYLTLRRRVARKGGPPRPRPAAHELTIQEGFFLEML